MPVVSYSSLFLPLPYCDNYIIYSLGSRRKRKKKERREKYLRSPAPAGTRPVNRGEMEFAEQEMEFQLPEETEGNCTYI